MEDLLADLRGQEATERLPFTRRHAAVARDNLPVQLTHFIGREREIEDVEELLAAARLVTLTGPGGTGKTRLSLQVATRARESFKHGVSFVALAAISDPALVVSTIALGLGVREVGGTPIIETMKRFLRDRETLLVLDNFEHVVGEAPVVTELWAASPDLKILVTSREPLHLSGECQFPVPPLRLPDATQTESANSLTRYEAVALFVERAVSVKPDFVLTDDTALDVAEICIRLDGLPLAIELAAARIGLLSPHAIRTRLANSLELLTGGPRDVPARQQTLRAAIRWSYDLLTPEEQKLFRRLSVFAGGCSFEAADAVCNGPRDMETDVLGGITSLVDKNLLHRHDQQDGEPRFFMLETIREFGRERLSKAGEEPTLRKAHRDYFLELAAATEHHLTGSSQAEHLDRLERDHDNFRAALEWCESDPNGVEEQLRLVGALWRFWLIRGHLSEGRRLLAASMARDGASSHAKLKAKALLGAGTLAHNQGDYTGAGSLFEQSLALNRRMNDKPGVAAALNNVGWAHWRQCEYHTARSLSEESLALHRELGDNRGIAAALANLGWTDLFQGRYGDARARFEASLELRRELDDHRAIAFTQCMLGWTELRQGNYEPAAELLIEASASFRELGDKQLLAFTTSVIGTMAQEQGDYARAATLVDEESLPSFREIGDRWGIAFALDVLGKVALHRGNLDRAGSLLEESLAIRRETEDRWGAADSLCALGRVARLRGDDDRAASCCRESLSLRTEIGDRAGIAGCLDELAILACQQERFDRAARLFGAAEALRESLPARRPPCDRKDHARHVAGTRAALGDDAFTAGWEKGRSIRQEDVIVYATSD